MNLSDYSDEELREELRGRLPIGYAITIDNPAPETHTWIRQQGPYPAGFEYICTVCGAKTLYAGTTGMYGICRMPVSGPVSDSWLKKGDVVELKEAYRHPGGLCGPHWDCAKWEVLESEGQHIRLRAITNPLPFWHYDFSTFDITSMERTWYEGAKFTKDIHKWNTNFKFSLGDQVVCDGNYTSTVQNRWALRDGSLHYSLKGHYNWHDVKEERLKKVEA
jgi:hypothetical protein